MTFLGSIRIRAQLQSGIISLGATKFFFCLETLCRVIQKIQKHTAKKQSRNNRYHKKCFCFAMIQMNEFY